MVKKCSKLFVGMDVHKDSIDVATGDDGGGEVRHYGAIGGDLAAVSRLVRKLGLGLRRAAANLNRSAMLPARPQH